MNLLIAICMNTETVCEESGRSNRNGNLIKTKKKITGNNSRNLKSKNLNLINNESSNDRFFIFDFSK